LDRYLAAGGERSRSDAGKLLRAGLVRVDGFVERNPARKVDPDAQAITVAGEAVADRRLQYYLLHKPAGVLTAARDSRAATVMSLLPDVFPRRKVFPVGRLDKDTTGLLLLTNDGELAHRLLSPRRHVLKEYHAWVRGRLTQEDVRAFRLGISLSDFTAEPAELRIVSASPEKSLGVLLLREGKFHQVKQMFSARGHTVLQLHRAAFGPLRISADLSEGAWRELSSEEIEALRQAGEG